MRQFQGIMRPADDFRCLRKLVGWLKPNSRLWRSCYVYGLVGLTCGAASHAQEGHEVRNTDWELIGNSAEIHQHSDLSQINRQNVSRLGLAWSADIPSVDGLVGNPLIKDGVIFQSGARGRMYANDLRTGAAIWKFEPPYQNPKDFVRAWASTYNRGLALADGLAIVGTGNCELIAVDQKTGKERWRATACESNQTQAITGAPRVGGGLVFIGNMCGDSGASRGHVDAFDVKTGRHVWRFYTVPGDPSKPQESALYEQAAKSWGTDWYSKSHGCGSPWDAMAYDPQLDQLYVGTGGPAPFTPTKRASDAGDELFTNAIIALKAKTGEYVWHFSEVPHDAWNYEAAVGIVVADLPIGEASRRVVISVPKNGFLYVLDARTGKFVSGKDYAPINWASGLDSAGRPIPNPAGRYWERPGGTAVVLPCNMGAHGWEALAYSPKDHLVYIPEQVIPARMSFDSRASVGGLSMYFYVGSEPGSRYSAYGELVAWDPLTQTARWRHKYTTPVNGGLLHTGDLVFQGTADGNFIAFGASDGKVLWSRQVNGALRGAPSTVMADGVQYIVEASGNANSSGTSSYVARYAVPPQSRTRARLVAFKLDGTAPPPPARVVPHIQKPSVHRFEAALSREGERIYEVNGCADCHGTNAESAGGSVPDLRHAMPASPRSMADIVIRGALTDAGMPGSPDMTESDVNAIYAFVVNEAWDEYDAQTLANRATKPKSQ